MNILPLFLFILSDIAQPNFSNVSLCDDDIIGIENQVSSIFP